MGVSDGYVLAVAGAFIAIITMRSFAPEVYDAVIVKMTEKWYAAVLGDLNTRTSRRGEGQVVLDVGIGTATALVRNKSTLVNSKVKIVGVDYDSGYIEKGHAVVEAAGLTDRVALHCGSFFDAALLGYLLAENEDARQFDVAYFSGSLTLLPDPAEALRVCRTVVKPGGLIYVTQTFQRAWSPGLGYIKPLLWLLTTIDFGQLTYETELNALVQQAEGMTVLHNDVIPGSVNNYWQAARMVVLRVDGGDDTDGGRRC
eukprot:COSAG05_NODE_652_length_8074_cov_668.123009_3_plen_257_part_00